MTASTTSSAPLDIRSARGADAGAGKPPAPGAPRGALLAFLLSPKGELYAAILAGLLLLAGFIAHRALGDETAARTIAHALYLASLAIGLVHGSRAAWAALRQGSFDIDVLMVVGAVLAAAMGAPAEGALLLFLFVLAGALEELAGQRTERAVEALHKLMPTRALRQNAQGEFIEVAPESLEPGDVIKVLPGESVPVDARVLDIGGDTSRAALGGLVNQASLTGESMPREVRPGDEVFAGTISTGSPMTARVTRPAKQSSLQRILDLVISAQQQREPVQRFIDRFSQPYAYAVMGVSALVFLIWWKVLEAPIWSSADAETPGALRVAITLLIVMSPCAIILATPTATLAGITRGARRGVLFKGGQSIERLARIRAVCFDKTGTLTVGRPVVTQIHPVGWSDEKELLGVAAGLELESTHPIARAIVEYARDKGVEPVRGEQHAFTPGRGVSGVFNGSPARLGNLAFTSEFIPVCLRQRVQDVLESMQERGQIANVIAHDEQAAVFVLSDIVRPGAETLVKRLHDLGVAPVVMLTGDNAATAAAVAKRLGIDEVHAELLPGDKVKHVEAIKRGQRAGAAAPTTQPPHRFTGVIGDGVNDAPALAAADVSIAIGSIGSDAALENADIVLLQDDLAVVPWAVSLARRVRRTIALNFTLALAILVVLAIWTLIGSRTGYPVPLWMGVLGHEGGTLLVVCNSLLILAYQSPRIAPGAHARDAA